jgi:hypothetical protein
MSKATENFATDYKGPARTKLEELRKKGLYNATGKQEGVDPNTLEKARHAALEEDSIAFRADHGDDAAKRELAFREAQAKADTAA